MKIKVYLLVFIMKEIYGIIVVIYWSGFSIFFVCYIVEILVYNIFMNFLFYKFIVVFLGVFEILYIILKVFENTDL